MTTNTTFYKFIIVLLIGACIFLYFTKSCNKTPNPVITQNNIVNDTVAKETARANDAAIVAIGLMADTAQLKSDLQHARDSLKQSTKIIHAANSQVTALANEVADAHTALDTLKYVRSCDSLALVTKANQGKFDMFERDSKNALNKCDALSANRAAIIRALTSEANGFKSAAQMLQKQNGVLVSALNPKAKVFVGIEGYTSLTGSGVGPGLMYEDKQERLYGLSGGIATTGGWWIGGKAYIKIQLHK